VSLGRLSGATLATLCDMSRLVVRSGARRALWEAAARSGCGRTMAHLADTIRLPDGTQASEGGGSTAGGGNGRRDAYAAPMDGTVRDPFTYFYSERARHGPDAKWLVDAARHLTLGGARWLSERGLLARAVHSECHRSGNIFLHNAKLSDTTTRWLSYMVTCSGLRAAHCFRAARFVEAVARREYDHDREHVLPTGSDAMAADVGPFDPSSAPLRDTLALQPQHPDTADVHQGALWLLARLPDAQGTARSHRNACATHPQPQQRQPSTECKAKESCGGRHVATRPVSHRTFAVYSVLLLVFLLLAIALYTDLITL
jgi:hypothetical protein